MPSIARAQGQVVRIGLPTKTYYPTIIAETRCARSCSRRKASRRS
jgi:hypothetical protein